jgi:hypothetical protein
VQAQTGNLSRLRARAFAACSWRLREGRVGFEGREKLGLDVKGRTLRSDCAQVLDRNFCPQRELQVMERDFWGASSGSKDGPVAAVNPDDLRAAWAIYRDVQARQPNRQTGVSVNVFQGVCSPGADIAAVVYRTWMLLWLGRHTLLSPWLHDGELDRAVFKVAATFPIHKMQVGIVQQGYPFDVQKFVRQIEEDTQK